MGLWPSCARTRCRPECLHERHIRAAEVLKQLDLFDEECFEDDDDERDCDR